MVALTVAVSVMICGLSGAVTTSVIADPAPDGMVAAVHVTLWPAEPHVKLVPVALTNVVPIGRVSITVTESAALGPVFETLMV